MLDLVNFFLKENKVVFLKALRCRLLFSTGKQVLSLHEISELENEKTSLQEDFLVYEFKMNNRIYNRSADF